MLFRSPGKGVFGLTGKIGCSGIHTDSKPNPSAVRAKAAGFAVYPVNGISNPIFITHLSGLDADNPQISQIESDSARRATPARLSVAAKADAAKVFALRTGRLDAALGIDRTARRWASRSTLHPGEVSRRSDRTSPGYEGVHPGSTVNTIFPICASLSM